MDIIRHCADQQHIRARALLRTRALNERQLDHFLILACARLTRTYILYLHEQGASIPEEQAIDILLHRTGIPTLAARVNLDTAFTTLVVRELAPGVIAHLHRELGNDSTLRNLFDIHNAA